MGLTADLSGWNEQEIDLKKRERKKWGVQDGGGTEI